MISLAYPFDVFVQGFQCLTSRSCVTRFAQVAKVDGRGVSVVTLEAFMSGEELCVWGVVGWGFFFE